jgi:nitroimidazol reductase NimA-like FMN-containing flavoprotein (pyridoxamine 5'-phosphate oxidase superfamily)
MVPEHVRVRRVPERGRYDRETIDEILDAALIAHVGIVDNGVPHVIPMGMARRGDEVLLHGSTSSRLMRTLATGAEVCVTVTHLDGVVVARSAFHSSMNYRSVVLYGSARALTDPVEKLDALRTLTDHLIPGRWDEVRPPHEQELKATLIVSVPIDRAAAKVRTGPPEDDLEDLGSPVWAGVIPLLSTTGDPLPDEGISGAAPPSVRRFRDRRE